MTMATAIGVWNWAANGGGVNFVNGVAGVLPQLCVGWVLLKLANNGGGTVDVAGEESKRVIHVFGNNAEKAIRDTRNGAAEFLWTAAKIVLLAGVFDAGCSVVSDVPVLKCALQCVAAAGTVKFAMDITGFHPFSQNSGNVSATAPTTTAQTKKLEGMFERFQANHRQRMSLVSSLKG